MTIRAELDIRTGPGRYRKVMWFSYQTGYGNDLENKPVYDWNEVYVAEFNEFFGPLYYKP